MKNECSAEIRGKLKRLWSEWVDIVRTLTVNTLLPCCETRINT